MTSPRKIDLAFGLHIVLLLVSIALFVVMRGMPLLSTLGFEAANVFVACLGPFFLIIAALNNKQRLKSFDAIMVREALWLIVHVGVLAAMLAANGVLKASCSEGAGLLPFLIIAVPPLLLLTSIGVVIAFLLRQAWLKFLVALLLIAMYIAAVCALWWQEPSFRLLTHASVIISSDLISGSTLSAAIVGFRAATLLLAIFVIWFGVAFLSAQRQAIFKQAAPRSIFGLIGLVILLLSFCVLHQKSLAAVGKYRADLIADYDLMIEQDGLKIFAHPLKTTMAEATSILREARYYQMKIKERLGELSTKPITIWLHHSHEEKYLYTGAKNVHFALPKHRELHIAFANTPHGVLGHELAHIYVGEYTNTFSGLPMNNLIVPNLALTEGLATALTPELNIRDNMTLMDQAQAMFAANILVNVDQLFSSNPFYFASAEQQSSYVYSAAIIEFMLEQSPKDDRQGLLKKIIHNSDLKAVATDEHDYALKVAAFMKKLAEPAPKNAVAWAKQNVKPSSILAADCSADAQEKNWRLDRALLNVDTATIKNIVEPLPKNEHANALKLAGERMLNAGNYVSAADLLSGAYADLVDAERSFLGLSLMNARINLDELAGAEKIVPAIDADVFFDGNKRFLIITKILLDDAIDRGPYHELSTAALKVIYAKNSDRALRVALMSRHIGQASALSNDAHPIVLIANYLEARYFYFARAYEVMPAKMQPLMEHQTILPELVAREARLMNATSLSELKRYQEALNYYQDLVHEARSPGERIALQDAIDRLNFYIQN